jgi:hypothetical protein
MNDKKCNKCLVILDDYNKIKKQNLYKNCNKIICKEYKLRNKEKISIYNKVYKEKNKKIISDYNKYYNLLNR